MKTIKLCRLDTPIIFIDVRINLSRFVVTACAATSTAIVSSQSSVRDITRSRIAGICCAGIAIVDGCKDSMRNVTRSRIAGIGSAERTVGDVYRSVEYSGSRIAAVDGAQIMIIGTDLSVEHSRSVITTIGRTGIVVIGHQSSVRDITRSRIAGICCAGIAIVDGCRDSMRNVTRSRIAGIGSAERTVGDVYRSVEYSGSRIAAVDGAQIMIIGTDLSVEHSY